MKLKDFKFSYQENIAFDEMMLSLQKLIKNTINNNNYDKSDLIKIKNDFNILKDNFKN